MTPCSGVANALNNGVGTLKADGWKRQEKPDEGMCRVIRQLVVQSVFARWSLVKQPSKLGYITPWVQEKIKEAEFYGNWKPRWGMPSKRTIDRRVNEAANPRFYPGGEPKILAVTAGVYRPNIEGS